MPSLNDTEAQIKITTKYDATGQKQAESGLASVGSKADILKQSLANIGEAVGGLAIFDKVKSGVIDALGAFSDWEASTAKMNAVLASTGDVSGITSDQAIHLAESLSKVTVFSKQTTLGAEDVLLTFRNISSDIFPATVKATQDLSTVMGVDLNEAAKQVGKALDDPVKGSLALHKEGVLLTTQQLELIKTLVNTGQGAKAQAIILKELQTEFGGTAEAVGKTFGGQLKILQNNFDDVKEKIGQVISYALGPIIDHIASFARNNQSLVISMGVAILAAGGFATAVIGVAGAIGLALTIIGGPFTILLGLIAALLGGVVFKAVEKFQDQIKSTASTVSSSTDGMARKAPQNFSQVASAASKTAEEIKKVNESIKQSNEDFQASMADLVTKHQDKVSSLKDQLTQEATDFATAQASKEQSYQDSLGNLKASYDDQVQTTQDKVDQEKATYAQQNDDRKSKFDDLIAIEKQKGTQAATLRIAQLQTQYADEQKKADEAYTKKLASLQSNLDKQSEKYTAATAKAKETYDKDIKNAQDAFDKKRAQTQKDLDAETVLLQKHAKDVAAVQGFAAQDEFDKLKASHAKQLKQYAEQKQSIIDNAKQTAGGVADNFNNIPSLINTSAFQGVGGKMGTDMAAALKKAFFDSFKSIFSKLGSDISSVFNLHNISESFKTPGDIRWSDLTQGLADLFRASGGPVSKGMPYIVGEKGPELFVPNQAGSITPNSQLSGSSVNITQYNTLGNQVDVDAMARTLGFQLKMRLL